MKTNIKNLADFTLNSGVVENATIYNDVTPALDVDTGTYIYHDSTDISNFGLICYVRFGDVTASQFRILLGVNSSGVGRALDFNMTGSSQTCAFVTISSFTGAADTTLVSKEFLPRIPLIDDTFYKISVVIANDIIKVFVNNYIMFESTSFVPTDSIWGYSGMSTSTLVYVSDTYWYKDQVFWGNVNLNAVPDGDGVATLYNQGTHALVSRVQCNDDGDYTLLVDDDPANFTKYFLIGNITTLTNIQPRGVGNITL